MRAAIYPKIDLIPTIYPWNMSEPYYMIKLCQIETRHPCIISIFTWSRVMKNNIVNNGICWEVLICPWVLAVVSRWNNLLEEIAKQLCSSKALLQLWQRYKDYSKQCASTVQQQEDRASELLKAATNKDIADDEAATWIQDCNVCLGTLALSHHAGLRHLEFSRARADCG